MQINALRYALIASIGGFVFGLDAAVISGTVRFITTEFQLSDLQLGAVVSAPGFGVIFALLFTGYLADKYGRKKVLQGIASLYIISAIWSTFSPDFINLLTARFIGGLAFTSLTISSMYIGEIAPANMRGKLVAMNQINIVLGLSSAYFLNYFILQAANSGLPWVERLGIADNMWRWMLGTEIIPALIWLGLLFSIPRSPRWLMLVKKVEEAKQVMEKIMPKEQIGEEIESIEQSLRKSVEEDKSIFEQLRQLFSPEMRLVCLIGFTFAVAQQVTGINAILFYAPTVFEQVGLGTDAAFMQAAFVGLSSLVFTILAVMLIDRVGRRPLTLVGLLWAVISLGICAYGFNQAQYQLNEGIVANLSQEIEKGNLQPMLGQTYQSDIAFKQALQQTLGVSEAKLHEASLIQAAGNLPSGLILFGIISFIAAFHLSVGPIMWVIFSEIFPTSVRGIAIPTFVFVTSVVSYLTQQFFPWQLSNMGVRDVFLCYAVITFLGFIALFRLLPETKNKSLEELEATLVVTP